MTALSIALGITGAALILYGAVVYTFALSVQEDEGEALIRETEEFLRRVTL